MSRYLHEVTRIRDVYARRDASGKNRLYGWNRPDELLSQYLLRSAAAKALTQNGLEDLSGIDCLDVGCGTGGWLRLLMEWGATPSRLHGVDLLPDRIEKARLVSPQIEFSVSNGWPLHFGDATMDLVSANTVFSSILDAEARVMLAKEMVRVLRPSGLLLIYDFRISDPRNRDTVGIGTNEIRRLFPGMDVKFKTVSLAPPLQRPLVKWSPLLAHAVEALMPVLRTHVLCTLRNR